MPGTGQLGMLLANFAKTGKAVHQVYQAVTEEEFFGYVLKQNSDTTFWPGSYELFAAIDEVPPIEEPASQLGSTDRQRSTYLQNHLAGRGKCIAFIDLQRGGFLAQHETLRACIAGWGVYLWVDNLKAAG